MAGSRRTVLLAGRSTPLSRAHDARAPRRVLVVGPNDPDASEAEAFERVLANELRQDDIVLYDARTANWPVIRTAERYGLALEHPLSSAPRTGATNRAAGRRRAASHVLYSSHSERAACLDEALELARGAEIVVFVVAPGEGRARSRERTAIADAVRTTGVDAVEHLLDCRR